jgi:hypothetical protein
MDSLIKPYNDRRASFGRHETFSLRYAWLRKVFQAFMKKKTIFSSNEATTELGKNMVNAIKFYNLIKNFLSFYNALFLGLFLFLLVTMD